MNDSLADKPDLAARLINDRFSDAASAAKHTKDIFQLLTNNADPLRVGVKADVQYRIGTATRKIELAR